MYQSRFYETAKEAELALKEEREQGDKATDEATLERLRVNSDVAMLAKDLTGLKKDLSELRKEEIEIIDSDRTAAEKSEARKRIDEQRQQIFVQWNKDFAAARRER
jgi:hypothetical protein